MGYSCPGNVRELENAFEHAFVLCTKKQIEVVDLPMEIRQKAYQPFHDEGFGFQSSSPRPRTKITKEALLEPLHECKWNKAEIGRRIGLSRTAIWKYLKKLNIPLKKQGK